MATVSDNFDRANSTSLGADWAEDVGNWAIASNRLQQGTAGGSYYKCRWVGAALASNDYAVQAGVYSGADGNVGSGVFGRGAVSATATFYALVGFPGDRFYIVEITAGAEQIHRTSAATCAASTLYTLRFECEGSTLRGYINGTLDANLTFTDASLATGAVGVIAYGDQDAGGSGAYVDDWTAYDLGGGAATSLLARPRRHIVIPRRRVF